MPGPACRDSRLGAAPAVSAAKNVAPSSSRDDSPAMMALDSLANTCREHYHVSATHPCGLPHRTQESSVVYSGVMLHIKGNLRQVGWARKLTLSALKASPQACTMAASSCAPSPRRGGMV